MSFLWLAIESATSVNKALVFTDGVECLHGDVLRTEMISWASATVSARGRAVLR